jgi:hypothetical protein
MISLKVVSILLPSGMIFCRIVGMLWLWWADQDGGAPPGLPGGERLPVEALVSEQVTRRWPGVQQVGARAALAGGGRDYAPGPGDAAAQVGLGRQPEP